MVRKTNVVFAIDGLLYDLDMMRHNGQDIEGQLFMVYRRLKRLSKDLKTEQRYNTTAYKRTEAVCHVCGSTPQV